MPKEVKGRQCADSNSGRGYKNAQLGKYWS